MKEQKVCLKKKRIKFDRLSEHATIPTKGSQYAAGYDLYSAYDLEIPAQGKALAKTDIAIQLPLGTYGRAILFFFFAFFVLDLLQFCSHFFLICLIG